MVVLAFRLLATVASRVLSAGIEIMLIKADGSALSMLPA